MSVLFFHLLANLLDFSDPNDVCSTRVILSWRQQFVAPKNFNHTNSPNLSGKHTHTRTHALGFRRPLRMHESLLHPQPTNIQPSLVFTFQIGLRFIVPAACLLAIITEHPLHLHPSSPQRVNCQRSNRASRDRWFC